MDNNGFVLLSENNEHTGRFFGQIDGTIMDSLVQDRIYKRVSLMDYQGVCSDRDSHYNAAGETLKVNTPFNWLLKYLLAFGTTWMAMMPDPIAAWPHFSQVDDDEYGMEDTNYAEDYETNYNVPPEPYEPTTPETVSLN